jgi:hypothetical protein
MLRWIGEGLVVSGSGWKNGSFGLSCLQEGVTITSDGQGSIPGSDVLAEFVIEIASGHVLVGL